MMAFDWNDQDEVGDTIWPDLVASEDHIVPHLMETEAGASFRSKNYEKSKSDEGAISNLRLAEKSTEAKNNNLSSKSESSSDFYTNEEPSSSKTEIDSWLDYSDLCMDLEDKHQDGESHNSLKNLMNDLTDANNMDPVEGDSMQLDCDVDFIGHEDRLNKDLFDSDWANFQDFDDIEKLFRKDESIFGQEMIDDAEGFLSQSKDVIDNTAQSIPMLGLPLCKDQTPDDGCCSFLLDDQPEEQGSPLKKEKVVGEKINLMSEKKPDENGKNKLSISNENYSKNLLIPESTSNSSISNPLQTFQSNAIAPPMQLGESKLLERLTSSNHVSFIKHEYPTYPVFQIDGNPKRYVSAKDVRLDDAKPPKISINLAESKLAIMTPQEKMEKLRRLQKMQAQLAIEQQHQQYSHQITPVDGSVCKVLSSSEQDESKAIYCQLQKVVEKMDMRTRFCMRDSLLRLAKSAAERQCVSNRSSANKSNNSKGVMSANVAFKNCDRYSMLEDTETDTNPIDRIVANLLFQRPTETFPRLSSYGPLSLSST